MNKIRYSVVTPDGDCGHRHLTLSAARTCAAGQNRVLKVWRNGEALSDFAAALAIGPPLLASWLSRSGRSR